MRRATPRTSGPCRSTRARNASGSRVATNRGSNSASGGTRANTQRRSGSRMDAGTDMMRISSDCDTEETRLEPKWHAQIYSIENVLSCTIASFADGGDRDVLLAEDLAGFLAHSVHAFACC